MKEKIVEIELVRSHFPSHILKVSVLLLPPLFLPSSAPACFRFQELKKKGKKNRVTSLLGYQLGSFSDVLQRINDLHLQLQTERCALQGPMSLAARLLSEVALILCGCTAHGPREQPCFAAQFLLNFQGLHNFPPAVSHPFWQLSVCQQHIVLLTCRRFFSHHRDSSEQPFVPKSLTPYNKGCKTHA